MLKNTNSHLSHPKYRPDIDGLRAIAVLSVLIFHAFPDVLKGGFIGVDIFFVISGYLISTIIFQNLDKGTFSFSEFYARRVRRIFPALAIVLIFCLGFGWLSLFSDEFNQLGKHIAAGAGFVSNLVLWSETGYFDNAAESKPLLHLWSLGVEEQYYIVWPLLLAFFWKRKVSVLLVSVLVLIASFFLNIALIKQYPSAVFYFPVTRFWELLFGSVLAWFSLYKDEVFSSIKFKISRFFKVITFKKTDDDFTNHLISILGLLLIVYGLIETDKNNAFPGYWALIPVIGSVLIIAAGKNAVINKVILSNRIVVWFGLISFPLYLWHWPLLAYGRIVHNEELHRDFRIIVIFVSILLAWLTTKFIEKPFRFGEIKAKLKLKILCVTFILLFLLGAFCSNFDFSNSLNFEKNYIKRDHYEFVVGGSDSWYKGKGDWLFLGNSYGDVVAKLLNKKVPTDKDLNESFKYFSTISSLSSDFNVKVFLVIGANKTSIYPEYLPDKIKPSKDRYIDAYLNKLSEIKNLYIYDSKQDLLNAKHDGEYLYWRTDTHWNLKGGYVAFSGLMKMMGFTAPVVTFSKGREHKGDLIGISKKYDFPLHQDDSWNVEWKNHPKITKKDITGKLLTPFGQPFYVLNSAPLVNKRIWVIGDSFSGALKEYFNATFREVYFLGHWKDMQKVLPEQLEQVKEKPDYIIDIRVERSFE